MPITTSSEEARELFFEAREKFENYALIQSDSLLFQALELDPNFALAHLYLFSQDASSIAIQLVDQVSPGESYLIKARLAWKKEDSTFRDRMTDSLLKLYPKDKHCLFFAGQACIDRDIKKAMRFYEKAIRIDKYYAAPHDAIATIHRHQNRQKEAEKHLLRYLELMPNSGYGYAFYGSWLQSQGQDEEALTQYLTSIRIDPGFLPSYWGPIAIYESRGQFDLALQYCDLIIEMDLKISKISEAYLRKANILIKLESWPQAFEVFDHSIDIFRERGDQFREMYHRHYKGWAALARGQTDLALSIFLNNLQILRHEEFEEFDNRRLVNRSYGCLSILYGIQKDTIRAKEYLIKAREFFRPLNFSWDQSLLNLYEGVYAFNMENYDLAETYLKQQENLKIIGRKYYLAETYRMMGKHEQATYYYELASQIQHPYWGGLFYQKSLERLKALENI